ncbi:MAG: phospho-N-acetylmuramoyl-pentapeptide-transferase [Eubacteriales bacterium]
MDFNIDYIWALVVSFILTVIFSLVLIPILKRIKAGQNIREDGPQSHLAKTGTPTMGGIAIILASSIAFIMFGAMKREMLIILVSYFAFGALGFTDDFVKVAMKRNLGLKAYQKLTMQVLIALSIGLYQLDVSRFHNSVYVPILNEFVNFGIFYLPFIIFVIVAISNSVNLTDGLDGLASSVTFAIALFLAIMGMSFGNTSSAIFCSAIAGACLGFLIFNKNPAKVFMGDTGSLALGGAIAIAAILMNLEMIIPIAGGIFVAEAASVVIQVGSFKLRGKRVFKMAPLHHHFELSGWKETKVVYIFFAITVLLCIISFLILRI